MFMDQKQLFFKQTFWGEFGEATFAVNLTAKYPGGFDDSRKETMVILAILRRLVLATTCQQGTGGRRERFLKRLFASSFQNPFQPCLQPW